MNKKTKIVIALLAAFVVLLVLYLAVFRPLLMGKENEASQNKVYGSYLFDPIDKNRVMSVILHPKDGKEYAVCRKTLTAAEVTAETVETELSRRLAALGKTAWTDELYKSDAKASFGMDLSAYSGETLEAAYLYLVYSSLVETAGTDATWCVEQDGVRYVLLTVDAWKLAELRTSARAVYLYNTVITTDPEKDALRHVDEAKFAEYRQKYGLTGDAWVEVSDADGRTEKIIVGNKDTTGQGYFVMLDGGDTIGTTNSTTLGGYLATPSAELVECRIVPEMDNTYSYAYPVDFTLVHSARVYAGTAASSGVTLKAGDVIGFTYSVEGTDAGGVPVSREGLTVRDVPLAADGVILTEAAVSALVGRGLGECDVSYPVEYASGGETHTLTVRITSIDYISSSEHLFSLHHTGTGDITRPVNIYSFTEPSDMTRYLPSDGKVMSAMEAITGMSGTVVELGLSTETFEKYGLWRHTVRVTIPYCKDPNGKGPDKDISEGDYYYAVESVLYISAVQPDGSYYVGSPAFDLVAKVDGESADFAEYTRFDWVEKSIFTTKVDDIETLDFTWNYGGELKGDFRVEIHRETRIKYTRNEKRYLAPNGTAVYMASVVITCPDGSTVTLRNEFDNDRYTAAVNAYNRAVDDNDPATAQIALDAMNAELGKPDGTVNFRRFMEQLLYLQYEGDLELSAEEALALASDPEASVLFVRLRLADGSELIIRFSPYTGARCMVSFMNTRSFFIFTSSLKTTAFNFLRVLSGEEINTQGRY